MANFTPVKPGTLAIIQQTETGRIMQIALTEDQSKMFNFFMAALSKEIPLLAMPEEYDLILKSQLINEAKAKNKIP